jgi:hypothetical protein
MRHSCWHGNFLNSRSAAISTDGCALTWLYNCCFFLNLKLQINKENLVRVQKKRPEPELGPGPKKVLFGLQNMGSITSRGPKRISKTPIVSLQSHRRRDDLIKRCVIHPISRMFSNIRLGNFGAKF